MAKMNVWEARWDLDEAQCPCDVHFNQWIESEGLSGKTIYHFGTGTHHVVGVRQSQNGLQNVVLGITASIEEYEFYEQLVTEQPSISKSYIAYFGDIYLTEPRLLPPLDAVTLFHLCEFSAPNTASPEYGGLTDLGLTQVLTDKLRPGGHILFYTGSFAFDGAKRVIAEWERPVERVGEFKTLLVYRKR